ncbi:hypothetical protein L6452_33689 [Arctium lappa]|uniref:Uncharacterized protein n=1 Tax=Arctium lappa TaxID=4217 RepID=A0ACB8YHC1_ARCLA|nr:hypothetical protein L6452_33689 [Arctium lappa]
MHLFLLFTSSRQITDLLKILSPPFISSKNIPAQTCPSLPLIFSISTIVTDLSFSSFHRSSCYTSIFFYSVPPVLLRYAPSAPFIDVLLLLCRIRMFRTYPSSICFFYFVLPVLCSSSFTISASILFQLVFFTIDSRYASFLLIPSLPRFELVLRFAEKCSSIYREERGYGRPMEKKSRSKKKKRRAGDGEEAQLKSITPIPILNQFIIIIIIIIMSEDEIAIQAIKHALKALRKRHLLEEGAHGPAFVALSKPIATQGSEWKDKAETLELELQQCYKAQARLSEQLVVEVAESRAAKALVQEKEALIPTLENDLSQARDECSRLVALLDEKTKALELLMGENKELRSQYEEMRARAIKAEAENKTLIDRWMLQKMQDAERLNEANALYEDMLGKLKASGLEQLARQQVDGVVRQSEEGAEYYVESIIPKTCKHRIPAHEGGCASIVFENSSGKLVSGGQDQTVKMWDTTTGQLTRTYYGCLGSILDLSITHDNRCVIAASSSNNLYVWDANSGRVRHTLTGHVDKVCAVDVSRFSNRHVASSAYDRTIKIWDLNKGYCINTIIFPSNCNALSFSPDGQTICSGHVDGHLRLWDIQTGKLLSEVAAHSLAVTSISLSRNGNTILTSGRDNLHNLFDTRTLEVWGTLRASGNRVASNWSRSCISADDNYVAAGSVDGSVHVWSISNANIVSTLKEHTASVLCCSWSGLGKPLATSDKNGNICLWT